MIVSTAAGLLALVVGLVLGWPVLVALCLPGGEGEAVLGPFGTGQ